MSKKDKYWNEKCPNCGGEDFEWDREDPASDLMVVTCQSCDASFEVIEDRRYILQRYTDEPKGKA